MTINSSATNIPRSEWIQRLSTLPSERVTSVADDLAQRYHIEDLCLPESGLALLPLRDGALGEAYFLGEIPLAQAHVRISGGDGLTVEGAALLLDDRTRLARAMAVLDGILAARLPGFHLIEELLEEGALAWKKAAAGRRAFLAATRVDFSLLGTAEQRDDD